ncbi:MAG: rod shape-determining protein MreD [Sedimentisphaerales bacterium]|nr:rod shape-determining protein MreD [Sedimentisphaerales bacterium]
MRWFRFAILIVFVTVVQASVLPNLEVSPDLLLILLVFFCIYCEPNEAIITSFAIGFAADLIGSPMPLMPMGPQTISFGLFGTLLAYIHRVINVRKMPYQALTIFITALLAGVLAQFLAMLKGHVIVSNIWGMLLGVAIYSGLVGPFLFLPSAWWMRVRMHRFARR